MPDNARKYLFPLRQLSTAIILFGRRANERTPLVTVLVGLRVAEVDQDTIAHVLRYEPAEPLHGRGDGFLVCGDDLAEVLRVRLIAPETGELPRAQSDQATARRHRSAP